MPVPLSTDALDSLNRQDTGEVWLILLTFDHPSLSEPLRFTSDAVATVSRGKTYISFPFRIVLPNADEDRPPQARLAIDNVDRRISETLRQISDSVTVRPELILASDPDRVEQDYGLFSVIEPNITLTTVEVTLSLDPWVQESYPALRFTPSNFRSLVG